MIAATERMQARAISTFVISSAVLLVILMLSFFISVPLKKPG